MISVQRISSGNEVGDLIQDCQMTKSRLAQDSSPIDLNNRADIDRCRCRSASDGFQDGQVSWPDDPQSPVHITAARSQLSTNEKRLAPDVRGRRASKEVCSSRVLSLDLKSTVWHQVNF